MPSSNPSYLNTINQTEVSVAIEHLIIAPYLTAWTPQRIDLGNLAGTAPGFFDLGSVVEDTPSFKATRERFSLETGIPAVTQFESVTKMSGELTVHLHSNSWRKVQYALGGFTVVSSSTLQSQLKIAANPGDNSLSLVSTTTLNQSICIGGQYTLSASLNTADNPDSFEFRVTSITSNGSIVTVGLNQSVTNSMAVNAAISSYQYTRQPIGGKTLLYYYGLGVADFIDGSQVIHECLKMTPVPEFTEAIHPAMNDRIPLGFRLFGIPTSYNGCADLIVANRYYFPKQCGIC